MAWYRAGRHWQGRTTAQDTYTPKPLEARAAPPAYEYRPSSLPFTGSSTARSDFTAKPIDPSVFGQAAAGPGYRPTGIPFAGESESQAAYQ